MALARIKSPPELQAKSPELLSKRYGI